MSFRSLRRTSVGALAGLLAVVGLGTFALPTDAAAGFTFTRYAGQNRFDTARLIATDSFGTAQNVLIARGDLFPDALAGSYLSGSTGTGAPILLVRTDSVPAETDAAITALGATRATILGGPNAVSTAVENQLRGRGLTVDRIQGNTRYDTAQNVAERPGAANVGIVDGNRTAIVASGQNFPDALAGGPLSYASKLPTILTLPTALSSQARNALNNLAIKQVYLLGGPAAVDQNVEAAIAAMGITVLRQQGANRQATAVTIAELAIAKLGFSTTHVNLARGDDFADALTLAPHAGKEKAPILLTGNPNTLSIETGDYLRGHSGTLTNGHIAGGLAAMNQAVQDEATAAATSGRATVSVPNANVAQGGNVIGTVTGANITGVTVSGCGLSNQAVTRDANGNFTFPLPASQGAGNCTLTFTTTFQGGGTEVDTVPITVGGPANNNTYAVAGNQASQDVSTTRTCTATVPSGTVVDITLLPSGQISTVSGQTLFKDADSNNLADEPAPSALITTVNGADVADAPRVNNTTSTGTVTFTITSATANTDVTAVVVGDNAAGNNLIDLVTATPANTNPKTPSEQFGVGCRTVFVPVENGVGASAPVVAAVNRDLNYFTSATSTYYYDGNDVYQFQGVGISQAQFESALTPGDVVGVSYAPRANGAAGVSTFNITTDNSAAPTAVTATAINADSGATANDVKVTFTPDPNAGSAATYTVNRGTVTVFGADTVCGGVGPNADTAPATFPVVVGPATVAPDASGVNQGTITDLNVPNGCYQYQVVAGNSGTSSSASAVSNSVLVPAAADATPPTITDVRASDTNLAGVTDSGDIHRFIFNEPMNTTSTTGNYAVSDADGTTANIVCGSGGTSCVLNAAPEANGTITYPAGRVMKVTVGTPTGVAGGNLQLNYPLTITALSTAIKDVAGNAVTTAGSDVTIELAPFTAP